MSQICLVSAPTETDREIWSMQPPKSAVYVPKDYPLGILTLAAEVEEKGFVPKVVDSNRWYVEFLHSGGSREGRQFARYAATRIAELGCSVAGFGTICSSYPLTIMMAEELKRLRPEVMVLFGGPQASVVDRETLERLPFIDVIVRGEADHSLPALLSALETGSPISSVAGITYRIDGQVIRAPDAALVSQLDLLPLPAFHLYPGLVRSKVLPLEHGRGCPFSCTFCSTNDFFRRRFRLKSPAKVMHEMDVLRERYSVEYFDLMHDMFTVDRRRVVEFCEAVLASGRQYRWGCSARTDCVDEGLLELMRASGCVSIFYGVETGSQKMQLLIDKDLDISGSLETVRCSCRKGMATVSSMIIGYPEENKDDLRATLSFIGEAMRQEKAQPHLHLLAPLAGTPLHQRYRQELVLKDIYTDISHNRFNQDANERNLIARYPELFPNFYLFPSHHLEHSYFYEVREFFVHGIRRFRWMLVAWHDRCGDLLALFDEWKEWAKQRCLVLTMPEMRRYYCSPEFDCAFVEFLGRRPAQQRSPFEEILLEFERRLLRSLTRRQERGRKISSPAINNKVRVDLAKNLFFLELAGDYARVISLLQQSLPPDSSIHHPSFILGKISPENGQCEMFLVQPAVATFLSLCDGQASLKQVLTRFAEKFGKIEDIPAREVAEYALQSLHQQKLLRFLSPLPSGHALRSTGKRAYSALSFAVSSTNH